MRDNPNLSPEQIDRIRSVAQLRSVQAGEVLYESSRPDVPLFVVLEGNVSISRTGEDDKILALLEANQFTGEMLRLNIEDNPTNPKYLLTGPNIGYRLAESVEGDRVISSTE